jgi:hypothetical protein
MLKSFARRRACGPLHSTQTSIGRTFGCWILHTDCRRQLSDPRSGLLKPSCSAFSSTQCAQVPPQAHALLAAQRHRFGHVAASVSAQCSVLSARCSVLRVRFAYQHAQPPIPLALSCHLSSLVDPVVGRLARLFTRE